jgi:hypothetical protein
MNHNLPPGVSLAGSTGLIAANKAVGTHGLAKRHQDWATKKAVGVAIAHGLVETMLGQLPKGALRPGQQNSAESAEPGCLGVLHHNAHDHHFLLD